MKLSALLLSVVATVVVASNDVSSSFRTAVANHARRRLASECTRTDMMGGKITTCTSDDFMSICSEPGDGSCNYMLFNIGTLVETLGKLQEIAEKEEPTPEDLQALFPMIGELIAAATNFMCTCENSTPDCSAVSEDYSGNSCTVTPDNTITCTAESEEKVCCDVSDGGGDMSCCRTMSGDTETMECTAGGDTGKIVLEPDSCTATHNDEACTCSYCDLDLGVDGTEEFTEEAPKVPSYDCSAVGGTKRECPDASSAAELFETLFTPLGSGPQFAIEAQANDPRETASEESGATGLLASIALGLSAVFAGLML